MVVRIAVPSVPTAATLVVAVHEQMLVAAGAVALVQQNSIHPAGEPVRVPLLLARVVVAAVPAETLALGDAVRAAKLPRRSSVDLHVVQPMDHQRFAGEEGPPGSVASAAVVRSILAHEVGIQEFQGATHTIG